MGDIYWFSTGFCGNKRSCGNKKNQFYSINVLDKKSVGAFMKVVQGKDGSEEDGPMAWGRL